MRTLTAMLHRGEREEGGPWATCLEVPGANGHGESEKDCLGDLAEAVELILEMKEENELRADPAATMTPLVVR